MKNSDRNWVCSDNITLTMNILYPNGWSDFVTASEIANDNLDYKKAFETLQGLYGDNYTIENTYDYVSNKLRFHIEQEVEKYLKQNEIWTNQVDRLFGEYNELNQFRIGDLKEDPENFDKYKSARQTELRQKDILKQIDELQKMKTPFETVIEKLSNYIFLPYVKGNYDYEQST